MATNTPRKARVAAASSTAAAVANTVIDSVIASGAAQLHLSDEVLEKLRVGWRDLYNELSGFTEEEIAREGAGRKRILSSSDENGVRDGVSDPDLRDEADTAPTAAALTAAAAAAAGSDSEDNSSTGASDSAAASNGAAAAAGGGGSATAVSAPAPYVVGTPAPFMPAPPQVVDDSERRRQNHLEATKRRRVQAAGKAQREARKASLAAAAQAPPVPVTAPFVADGILMGTFSMRIRGNKEDNTLTVYVENALLRGKSRDLVFGSVKCSLRLEQLRDMRLDSEEDIAFFARAPAEEAVAEQERFEKLRRETGELDFTDVFDDEPAAALSAAAEVDDAGYGAVKRARGRPRKQKTQQQQNQQQQQQQKQSQKPQQKQQQKSSAAANNSGSSSSSISSNMTAEQLAPYTMFGAEFMKAIGISTDKLKGDLVDPMAEALAASAKLMAADCSTSTASSTAVTATIAATAVDCPFAAVVAAAATMPDIPDAADDDDLDIDAELEATATTDVCSSDDEDDYTATLASVTNVHRPAVRAAKTPDAVVNAMSRAGVYIQYNSDDD
eukprot:21500-Heterococcus_DN1.PRE.2